MRKLNLYYGLLLLLIFLGTGLYLKFIFRPENLANTTARMEIRASHIYILFVSLLNIFSSGIHLPLSNKWVQGLERVFRFTLMLAGLLAVTAFLTDHPGTLLDRKLTFYAVLLSLSSAVLFLIAAFLSSRANSR
ncbi:MAG: hypothetical protein K8S54_07645 [Spirochaetia bacterium]|nr:hypothetical protein [Spirochaetia bacterium]